MGHQNAGRRVVSSSVRTTYQAPRPPTRAAATTSAGPTVPPARTARSAPASRIGAQAASAATGASVTVTILCRVRWVMCPP